LTFIETDRRNTYVKFTHSRDVRQI